MKSFELGNTIKKSAYFPKPEERKYIYELSRDIGEYLHDKNIPNIILLDRSARTAWVGLDEYWKNNYKGEKRPNIYFINPDGFDILTNYIKKNKIPKEYVLLDKLKYAETGKSEIMQSSRSDADTATFQFSEAYKSLAEDLDKPLAVYDNCAHSKYTMSLIVTWLKEAGYENLHVLIGDMSGQNQTEAQAEANKIPGVRVRTYTCDPFGYHVSGTKKGTNVFSDYDPTADRKKIIGIRQEIRRIIQNQGK